MNSSQIRTALITLGGLGLILAGCASNPPKFTAAGAVFYCGGAGDGITNWGLGVKKGLENAG